ncbi:MAG: tetratricopeptide repeat protein [Saprospiraceae bacterium]
MKYIKSSFTLITFLFILSFVTVQAQPNSNLAQQYYQNGEYEKAASLYEKLYRSNEKNSYYFNKYIDCLISLEEYDKCEKEIKKEIKKKPKQSQLLVTLGNLYERQYKDEEAKKQYEKAIDQMEADRFTITKLANSFLSLTKYDLAIAAYEKGSRLLKDKNIFAYNLADLYRRKGDTEKMIDGYLNSLAENPTRLNNLKTTFQRYLSEEDYDELQVQLYDRIQEEGDVPYYPELLAWVFVQRKDYQNALRQIKALDRQLGENGGRVYRLAGIAANAKDYDTAIQAYDYIIAEKGAQSTYYIDSKRESLTCERDKLVEGFDYTEEDLRQLEAQYENFLTEFGRNKTTATIIAELANLEAFYLKDFDKAIALLNEMIQFPMLNPNVQSRGKISLADFYLMQGERWEATLLYSQVDKIYKDDILGHEARFKNAKLSYYVGDFEWAQTQFDVLKASTSKLIANDALDLSIFIMDHLGLDSTAAPMMLYAQADLLVFQNNFEGAFLKLDTIQMKYPEHTLEDDIFYLESKIYTQRREYEKAAEVLEKIIEKYADGIRADNALFDLATLNENHLGNVEKAKTLYEKIFVDYSGSTFAVEARKRFRILRGDEIQ